MLWKYNKMNKKENSQWKKPSKKQQEFFSLFWAQVWMQTPVTVEKQSICTQGGWGSKGLEASYEWKLGPWEGSPTFVILVSSSQCSLP